MCGFKTDFRIYFRFKNKNNIYFKKYFITFFYKNYNSCDFTIVFVVKIFNFFLYVG
jgi:hypothetical protein